MECKEEVCLDEFIEVNPSLSSPSSVPRTVNIE